MRRHFKTVHEYIGTFPADVQRILERIRQTIRQAAPEATEAISYQIPAFKLHGNLVFFAAFKSHVSLYPRTPGMESLKKELSPYIKGKGTLQFPLDQPVPYGLVKRIVAIRVGENSAKKKQKSSAPNRARHGGRATTSRQ
jgi:uncharacterized protein YdhG (YjbR/CyaY superfamily)